MSAAADVTFTGDLMIEEPQLRVTERDARTALRAVVGQPVVPARARLRFGPGRTCEPLARVLDRAIVGAENAGLDPGLLLVADGTADAAEDIVRVRRAGYGIADWVHSPTCRVRIVIRPASLRGHPASAEQPAGQPAAGPLPDPPETDLAATSDPRASAVRDALADVIDPDLGVNIVDLGFVRAISVTGGTAVITMTLTSPACPLTDNLTNQIRDGLADVEVVEDFRIEWQWIPAWGPQHVTESGREQLRAIGFTI